MESMDLKTDFKLLELLEELISESGAALSLRTFIRVLPLISLYSEVKSTANYKIEPLGFWPFDDRQCYVDALVASIQQLKGVLHGHLDLDLAAVNAVDWAVEAAKARARYNEIGEFWFLSREQKKRVL